MQEFYKAIHEHLGALLNIVGGDEKEKAAANALADMVEEGNVEEGVNRVTSLLSNARYLHDMLGRSMKKGDEPEPLDKGEGKGGKVEAVDKEEGKMAQEEKDPKTTAPDAPVLKADEVAISKAELDALRAQAAQAESTAAVNKTLEQRVAKMEDDAKVAAHLKKAEKYPSLGFDGPVLADMIRKMEEGGIKPEDVDAHFTRLDKQLKESNLLKEKGAGGDGQPGTVRKGATAFEIEVQKQVDGLIQKGDKQTPERLFSDVAQQVARDNPELYEAHRAEIAPPK